MFRHGIRKLPGRGPGSFVKEKNHVAATQEEKGV
jgi:hypothetical protein